MITIQLNLNISGHDWIRDVLRSISAQASAKNNYEIIKNNIPEELVNEFSKSINFSESEYPDSKLVITLPGDILVMGYHWDKYLNYNLDNDKVIDSHEVIKRMGIFMRRGGNIRSEIQIKKP